MSSPKRKSKGKTTKADKNLSIKKPKSDFNKLSLVAFLALTLLTLFTYQNALDNDFVSWDDFEYVIDNDLVNAKGKTHATSFGDVFSQVVSLNYHPLTILTMRWNDNQCSTCPEGISARPFIFWNIILHILNSLLLLLFAYWMFKKNILPAFFVAIVFALHPMHVESVAWVSERKDVLYSFFFLSGLLSYIKYLSGKQKKWLYASLLLFILSCLSKAMAVVFPLMMFLVFFWNDKSESAILSLRKSIGPAFFKHSIPFFIISLFFGAMAVSVQGGGDFAGLVINDSGTKAINEFDTFSILQRFQFASYGYLQYIFKFFYPFELCAFYPYPDQISFENSSFYKIAPLLFIVINALAVVSLKFTKSIFMGLGIFLVNIIFVLQFISVGGVIMADRYSYLSFIGISIFVSLLVLEFLPKSRHVFIFSVLIVLVLALIPKTKAQIDTWEDSESLWTRVIELNTLENGAIPITMDQPLSARGITYGKLAERAQSESVRQKYIDKAYDDFKIASDMNSKRADVYEGLGNIYGIKRDYPNALANYNKAIRLNPASSIAYENKGITYAIMGNHSQAATEFTQALQYNPANPYKVFYNRGRSYFESGQFEKAKADFQKVLQYNPNDQNARNFINRIASKN